MSANMLSDRLRNALKCDGEDARVSVDKPDFRELDLDSPLSTLRTRNVGGFTPSTSSSSSGSVSAAPNSIIPTKSDSSPNNRSGELSVESSPSGSRNSRPRHNRSRSCGSHQLIFSGSGSLSSSAVNVAPTGNIFPSGKVLKTGMASRSTKPEIMGSGLGNYGHGSIMRGGIVKSDSYSTGVPEAWKRMGNDSYMKGNFAEALTLYEKAIAVSPNTATYHFNRAAALMGLKRLVEAIRECEEAVRLDPGYERAHRRLGSLLLSLGQVENARKHICFSGYQPDSVEVQKLQAVEKHLSNCNNSRRVHDWKNTLKEVEAAIVSGADTSPQLYACKAEALLKLHQVDDACLALSNIRKLEQYTSSHASLKIFGMLFEAYVCFVSAQVELSKGRFDSALITIEKAGQIDHQNIEITTLLNNVRLVCRARAQGNELFKLERFTEACLAYGEGLRLDPSNSVLYCNRAACWFKLGQWERSVDDCNLALRIQPYYIKALLRRASSNCKLARWSEAVRDFEVLRRELPDDKEVAESLFHSQVALKKSRGEEIYNMKFGGDVESVSGLENYRAAISSYGASVVHFKAGSNAQSKQMSPFLDALCTRYPSISFLKVDIEESHDIARAESIKIAPTFKIYRKGNLVKEIVCPTPEVLEAVVRHHSI